MTVTIETDLREILAQINQKLDNLQKDVTELKITQVEIKGEIKTLDEKFSGAIKTLDEKIDGLGKRVETQEFISKGILVGLILALLGGFAKLFGFVGTI